MFCIMLGVGGREGGKGPGMEDGEEEGERGEGEKIQKGAKERKMR